MQYVVRGRGGTCDLNLRTHLTTELGDGGAHAVWRPCCYKHLIPSPALPQTSHSGSGKVLSVALIPRLVSHWNHHMAKSCAEWGNKWGCELSKPEEFASECLPNALGGSCDNNTLWRHRGAPPPHHSVPSPQATRNLGIVRAYVLKRRAETTAGIPSSFLICPEARSDSQWNTNH